MNRFVTTNVGGHIVEKLADQYLKEDFCKIASLLSEELDKKHEKMSGVPCSKPIRFRKALFNLNSDYKWVTGWKSKESSVAFNNEIVRVFRKHKWSIHIPADSSSCIVVKKHGQALYCHGMSLEGNIIESDENLSEIISTIDEIDSSVAVISSVRLLGYSYNLTPSELTELLFSDRVTNLIGWWILIRTDGKTDNVPVSDKERPPYTINEISSDLNVLFRGSTQLETYWTLEQFIRGLYRMLVKAGDLKVTEKDAHCHYGETITRKFRMKKDKYKLITSA